MSPLTEDEIDNILYFSRANELEDLKTQVLESSREHNYSNVEVLKTALDEETGNTAWHYSCANGHIGSPRH
jgi:uncharacterized protein